jgi:hypothetical protein
VTRADKAALRVTCGLGAATALAYGFAVPMPFVACVMAALVLCKPGPPLPLAKGAALALVFGGLLAAGMLMVPLLEHYAFTGVLLTASILFVVFYGGLLRGHALTTVLLLAFALIPVAGVAEQALVSALTLAMTVGLAVAILVNALSHALFPDRPATGDRTSPAHSVDKPTAAWIALRGTLIVMPVFVLALTNPSLYIAAIMKTVTLGQQASHTTARNAGRELVGSTLTGALLAAIVWLGLSLWPSLWMLTLWLMAAALWCASAMLGLRRTSMPPSFWVNTLVTALILLGPAIEDSASGKSVLQAAVVRTCLFVAVAVYAWATVWALEHWRLARRHSLARVDAGARGVSP